MFFSVVPQCRFVFIQLLLLTRKGVDCNEIITVILLSNLSCYCVPVVNVIKRLFSFCFLLGLQNKMMYVHKLPHSKSCQNTFLDSEDKPLTVPIKQHTEYSSTLSLSGNNGSQINKLSVLQTGNLNNICLTGFVTSFQELKWRNMHFLLTNL